MPAVSILKRDGTATATYSTYEAARFPSVSGDVIQIWADLTEQIILKNGVDIWIMPGVELNNTSGVTITDIESSISHEIHCKIYGQGKIKNMGGYSCVFLDNINSELTMECYSFDTSTGNSDTIKIIRARKFHLLCKSIISKGTAINIAFNSQIVVEDINLKVNYIETGHSSGIVATSIVTYANGFININEILCKNSGHCFRHSEGSIIARIQKLTNIRASSIAVSTVTVGQGDGLEKLILYFDEIQALGSGSFLSYSGITVGEGTGIFIGRKVFSMDSPAIEIGGASTKGYIKCNEIISQGRGGIDSVSAVNLSNFTNQITIDANYIQGYRSNGVVFINDANVQIKNAKLVNTYTGTSVSSLGIFIAGTKVITLINVQIVIGELSNGRSIYHTGSTEPDTFDLKNYGLFVNKAIDSNLKLLIGTNLGTGYNYQYIIDPLLT
ncbi:MAG: hypothetical protein IPP52_06645 [Ignavibacteria bacterium]|nr:hypothetical protein [Ignavibacteria bacterium]